MGIGRDTNGPCPHRLGRRRVAAIGVQDLDSRETQTSQLRLRGYMDALADSGLALDPGLIIRGLPSYNRVSGARSMRQLLALDSPPDAVFCFNDHLALGVMRAIYDAGLRVPEDIAVVGFDDIPEAAVATPPLTTVRQPLLEMGGLALRLLDQMMHDPPKTELRLEVATDLVVRISTGPVRLARAYRP